MLRIGALSGSLFVGVVLTRLLMAAAGGGSFPIPGVPGSGTVVSLATAPASGWVWFQDARAVQYGGYLYVGVILDTGDVQVRVFDDATGAPVSTTTLHAALEPDDHDDPSVLVDPVSHKLVTFYSKHLGPVIYRRISTTSLDTDPDLSDGFDTETSFAATFEDSADRFLTYPNTVFTNNVDGSGDDTTWLFYRVHMGGTDPEWHYNSSEDAGVTWDASNSVRLHSLTYSRIVSDGVGRIDVAVSDHPGDVPPATKIYHLYRESAAWHQSDGTSMGAGIPFDESDMTVVYDGGSDLVWISDIAYTSGGDPVITFVRFESTTDHRYMYARWTGAAWDVHEVANGGSYIIDDISANPLQVYYSGEVIIDHADANIIYYSAETAGQFEMWKAETADGGATWTKTQLTTASSGKNIRPVSVRNADNFTVLWNVGTYTDYFHWSLGISGYIP